MLFALEDDEKVPELVFGAVESLGVTAFEPGELGGAGLFGAVFFLEGADEAGGGIAGVLASEGGGGCGSVEGTETREEGEDGVKEVDEGVGDLPGDGERVEEERDYDWGASSKAVGLRDNSRSWDKVAVGADGADGARRRAGRRVGGGASMTGVFGSLKSFCCGGIGSGEIAF